MKTQFLIICFFAGAVIMLLSALAQHVHGYWGVLGFILMAVPLIYCLFTGEDLDQ